MCITAEKNTQKVEKKMTFNKEVTHDEEDANKVIKKLREKNT